MKLFAVYWAYFLRINRTGKNFSKAINWQVRINSIAFFLERIEIFRFVNEKIYDIKIQRSGNIEL
ncbi:MAG: hypothetical protein HF982_01655 [Desulfobacteraceae bacterium]|nr:hypothetical protein [Desulfobacteraceae bacterium]MBC2718300.1 hypothetical protein [Desulfobacteraceae bacterium]